MRNSITAFIHRLILLLIKLKLKFIDLYTPRIHVICSQGAYNMGGGAKPTDTS